MCVVLSVALLGACSKNQPPPQSANGSETASNTTAVSQVYTVGVDISRPPFTFRDEIGKPTGFDVEILQAIADDQKFGVEFIHAPWQTLFTEFLEGKYHISASALKITQERAEKAELSDPYAQSYRAVLSHKNKPAKSGQELATLGGKVAVHEGSSSHVRVSELGIKPETHDSLFGAFKSFMSGQADYMVDDAVALTYLLKTNANEKMGDYILNDFGEGVQPIVYAIGKGNTELLNKVNAGLKNIKQNGKYDEIYNKYFTDKSASVNQK